MLNLHAGCKLQSLLLRSSQISGDMYLSLRTDGISLRRQTDAHTGIGERIAAEKNMHSQRRSVEFRFWYFLFHRQKGILNVPVSAVIKIGEMQQTILLIISLPYSKYNAQFFTFQFILFT